MPTTLSVSDGDDITSQLNNTADPVIPPGSYRLSGDVGFWGKTIRCDGDVTLRVPGGLSLGNETGSLAFKGNGTVGFTEAAAGSTLTIDQTASRSAARVQLGAGGQFGDDRGTIVFDGAIDLQGQQKNSAHPYHVSVAGSGTMTFRNVHFRDGCMDPSNWGFLWTNTSGTVRFDGCYIRGYANNCIYASDMPGRLEITGCYFEDNTVSAIRTGAGSGTYIADTVFHRGTKLATQWFSGGTAQRGIWCQTYNGGHKTITCERCTFIRDGPAASAAFRGDSGGSYTVNLTETRFSDPSGAIAGSNITVNGSVLGNPTDPGPPTPGGTAPEPEPDPEPDPEPTPEPEPTGDPFIVHGPDSGSASYTFTVAGSVEPGSSLEANDAIVPNDDGQTEVSGRIMEGFLDDYVVTGDLVSFEYTGSRPRVTRAGTAVDVDAFAPSGTTVRIQGTGGQTMYIFSASVIEKRGDAEEMDIHSDWGGHGFHTVAGRLVGTGVDSFRIEGGLKGFQYAGSKPTLYVAGTERDPDNPLGS